jgi:hypothetical protein
MDIPAVLTRIRPGASWALNGDNFAGLTWLDDSPAPTLAEVEAAWPSTQAALENDQARRGRLSAFRDEADPLFFGWQRGENTEQEWLNKCEEIRQRFPYVPVPALS